MRLLRFLLSAVPATLSLLALAGCGGSSSSASCNVEQSSLSSSFSSSNVSKGYLSCQADTDCEWSTVSQDGACVAACGALSNKASASNVAAAASAACAGFDVTCPGEPLPACPSNAPPICAAGTCATYSVYLSPASSTLTLADGVCAPFEAVFQVGYPKDTSSEPAPHDIPVAITATAGTLYSDAACTQVLATTDATTMVATGTVTIAGGASHASFGFVPAAAGAGYISLDGVTSGFNAK